MNRLDAGLGGMLDGTELNFAGSHKVIERLATMSRLARAEREGLEMWGLEELQS